MKTKKNIDRFIALSQKYIGNYFWIAISVFIFILFFQPFDFKLAEYENNLIFIAGFGMIVLMVLFVTQIIFQFPLSQIENETQDDTIYLPLYFFTQVAGTALAFIFYLRYVGQHGITFGTVIKVVFISVSLPVTIYLKSKLTSYKTRLKNLLSEKRLLQDKLNKHTESYANKHIEIISGSNEENFRIRVSEIVFLKSADNYVEVGYHDNGVVKKKMIRNTLRHVEQQLMVFNNFIRTHRTSIVNIQYIDKLNKSFNTYWLSLENTTETVAVSRQHIMAVKDLL